MLKKFIKQNFTETRKPKKSPLFKVSKKLNGGFTMAEMLVVIAIFSILTTVVVFQYGKFNSQTIMTNMAYEVALATRQAQVFALGVRGQTQVDNFSNRYGVYFNKNRNEKEFIFFIDRGEAGEPESASGTCDADPENPVSAGGDDCWDCLSGGECLEKMTLTRDIFIDRMCVSMENEPINLQTGECVGGGNGVDQITITFQRPNPDAIVYDSDNLSSGPYSSAAIVLSNNFNNQRAVVVRNTGQISVEILPDK